MKYNDEIQFLNTVENKLNSQNTRTVFDESKIFEIKEKYPKVPQDYLDYLQEIGAGSFRECQFSISEYLFDLKDLGLDEHYKLKDGIMFFGDNFSGDLSGFDFNNENGFVIEFWHEDGTIYETKKTFKDYIRQQMLIGENGEDTRIK